MKAFRSLDVDVGFLFGNVKVVASVMGDLGKVLVQEFCVIYLSESRVSRMPVPH
jgi:hypothetical protein